MYYSILHKTRYRYSALVTENVTEVRMQPRSEGVQRCLNFKLSTSPFARIYNYRDSYGNVVHYFDIPTPHRTTTITAESLVILPPLPSLPEALSVDAWAQLDAMVHEEDQWDFLNPSHFVRFTPLLLHLADELSVTRHTDPLSLLRMLNERMYATFGYDLHHTEVDSPIDLALEARKGVCQDFAHIMIALVRSLGIPCRYVSGYLFHRSEDNDRSYQDATHAWVEALLPDLGWVGFDPTNKLIASNRHIRTAVGRDYADVAPSRGVFKGHAESILEVGVKVVPTELPIPEEEVDPRPTGMTAAMVEDPEALEQEQQQQQ